MNVRKGIADRLRRVGYGQVSPIDSDSMASGRPAGGRERTSITPRFLKVVNSPRNDLALTNKAYCSPNDAQNFLPPAGSGMLRVTNGVSVILTVEPHTGITDGSLALNGKQRETIRVSTNDDVQVEQFFPAKDSDLVMLEVEIEFYRLRGNQVMQLDANVLSQKLISQYDKQMMTVGQKVPFEFQGTIYIFNVMSTILRDQKAPATLGQICSNTSFRFATNNSGIKVISFESWVLAEVSIVASDIPEVIGSAYALNMLFRLPVWLGVLLTGLSTLLLLALQQYGVRKLEVLIAFLVFTMAACFFGELGYAKPPGGEILKGLVIPKLRDSGATGLAISLLGAMVMPHNLFLHSALVLTRKIPRTLSSIRDGCRYYMVESGLALFLSFLINVCVIAVSGSVCSREDLAQEYRESCSNLDLNRASFLLQNVLGRWSFQLFAVALLASGQSSTITGTYAGQYVMQGFLNLQFQPWLRNLFTRSVAIVPSLIVAVIGGPAGAGRLIIISSMILSFQLPFALLPLLKFTSSMTKMGPHANSKVLSVLTWLIGFSVMLINIWFVSSALFRWLLSSDVSTIGRVLLGMGGVAGILVYLAAIAYLAFRTDREVTYFLSDAENSFDGRMILSDDEASGDASEVEMHGLLDLNSKDSAGIVSPADVLERAASR